MKDLYKILGIKRSATNDEIRQAYVRLRKEAGANPQGALLDRIQEAGHAWDILGNFSKKSDYDQKFDAEIRKAETSRQRTPEGRTTQQRNPHGDSVSDLFHNIFGGSEAWASMFGSAAAPKQEDFFLIPENDIGLLQGLIAAYKAIKEGRMSGGWKIKRAETDTREWMVDYPYKLILKEGKIQFYRKVKDWRMPHERERDINIYEDKPYSREIAQKFGPNDYLHAYYLWGEGRKRIQHGSDTPYNYGEYIDALYSLAEKIAFHKTNKNGNYDTPELDIITRYARTAKHATAEETKRESMFGIYNDNEAIRKIPLNEFWHELEKAESLVEVPQGHEVERRKVNLGPEITGRRKFDPNSSGTENKG